MQGVQREGLVGVEVGVNIRTGIHEADRSQPTLCADDPGHVWQTATQVPAVLDVCLADVSLPSFQNFDATFAISTHYVRPQHRALSSR
jgi:hypothetical protein